MKLIFLDIDGVLNSQYMYADRDDEIIDSKGGKLSKRCIKLLNNITEDTGAKIVLSSTWRTDKGVESFLCDAGIAGEIIGKTPYIGDRWALRGNEILAWIKENSGLIGKQYHEYHSFIILDDDSDMLYWQRENFFHTDAYAGLTPNIAYKATRFLNRF